MSTSSMAPRLQTAFVMNEFAAYMALSAFNSAHATSSYTKRESAAHHDPGHSILHTGHGRVQIVTLLDASYTTVFRFPCAWTPIMSKLVCIFQNSPAIVTRIVTGEQLTTSPSFDLHVPVPHILSNLYSPSYSAPSG